LVLAFAGFVPFVLSVGEAGLFGGFDDWLIFDNGSFSVLSIVYHFVLQIGSFLLQSL
jgi:hypothetical protein